MQSDIVSLLLEMKRGQTALQANQRFAEVLMAVRATKKKGRLTIQLDVTPSEIDADTGEVSRVSIDPEIKIVRPELALGSSIYFVTNDGGLSRQDPKQFEMFEVVEQVEVRKLNGEQA